MFDGLGNTFDLDFTISLLFQNRGKKIHLIFKGHLIKTKFYWKHSLYLHFSLINVGQSLSISINEVVNRSGLNFEQSVISPFC